MRQIHDGKACMTPSMVVILFTSAKTKTKTLSKGLCHARAKRVITYAKAFLDKSAPLQHGTYDQITGFAIDKEGLSFVLNTGRITRLVDFHYLSVTNIQLILLMFCY